MNYHFFRPSRCLVIALFFFFGIALFAQTAVSTLPDSLPDPDSLSYPEVTNWALQLSKHAQNIESELSRRTLTASIVRESAERNMKAAKQDSLTPKPTLDSLTNLLKTAKNVEKTAQKNQKQASQTVAFADKVANMDSINQRKNLRKAWKQVKELEVLLNPPPEKVIATLIGTEGVSGSPVDSAALAVAVTDKRKNKDKKTDNPGSKYKPYDPAADVMRNPPPRPCSLAVSTRDEFSGETYRETRRDELFRYTNEVMKKVLPPGQPHIVCEAALSNSGANTQLLLTFTIHDPNARKSFGSLAKNSIASLKFLDGDTFTLNSTRNDDGVRDESGQFFIYQAQYPFDATLAKKLRKTELDKLRIAWSTGYEDYEVQGVDVLMGAAKCLFE